MQSLPHELVTHIGEYLPHKSALWLYNCCKYFRKECYLPNLEKYVRRRKESVMQQIVAINYECFESYEDYLLGAMYNSSSWCKLPCGRNVQYKYELRYRPLGCGRALLEQSLNVYGLYEYTETTSGYIIGKDEGNHFYYYSALMRFNESRDHRGHRTLKWFNKHCPAKSCIIIRPTSFTIKI
jgi:hypothetical protein